MAFHAGESLRGHQARCRGCGQLLQISGPDPLGLIGSDITHQINVLAAPMADLTPMDDYEIPWTALKRIWLFGGMALAAVVLVTTALQYLTPLLRGH
jgi:hypothetical protein